MRKTVVNHNLNNNNNHKVFLILGFIQAKVTMKTQTINNFVVQSVENLKFLVYSSSIIFFIFSDFSLLHSTSANPQIFGLVSKNPDDIKFYLFRNPEDDEEKQQIHYDNETSLMEAGYNSGSPLILLLHGVLSNHLTISDVQQVKNAYLSQNYPANLIMVDYGDLTVSKLPFLLSPLSIVPLLLSHLHTDIIATRVAEFILFLMKSNVLSGPENTHLIGFSLGGHIAGTAGRHVAEQTGRKIRRITGLDPSPQIPLSTLKLDPSDADMVDITLTSLGTIATFVREGHIQFFINGGGPHQPNCPNLAPATETYCSHTTAVFYFAKSIKKRDIPACACTFTCKTMPTDCTEQITYGHFLPETAQGKFYVKLD